MITLLDEVYSSVQCTVYSVQCTVLVLLCVTVWYVSRTTVCVYT